jgi:hypothetical protein
MMDDKKREYNRRYYQKNKIKLREKKRLWMQKDRQANRDKYRHYWRQRKVAQRQAILKMYGCECALCGFTDQRALTLDHINGDGGQERRAKTEYQIYRDALETYQPEKFRTLCMNCQFITRSPQVVKRILEVRKARK